MLNDQEIQTEFYRPLSVVTGPPKRILTSQEFLGIGHDVGADRFDLIVRIPGDKDAQLLVIEWRKDSTDVEPQVIQFSQLKNPIIKNVLTAGSEISWSAGYENVNDEQVRLLEKYEESGSLLALPLSYQGVITGCVCFRSESRSAFGKLDVSKIRKFVPMAALLAQGERDTSALDRFSTELIRWRVKQGVMKNTMAIEGIADIMKNIFSTAAIIIDLNAGFRRYVRTAGESEELHRIQKSIEEGFPTVIQDSKSPFELIGAKLLDVVGKEEDIDANDAGDKDKKKKQELVIGSVYALVHKERGGMITRGASYSSRRAIATLVTDAVLNAVRDGFHSIIKKFGVALSNKDLTSAEQWFAEVDTAAKEARLAWVVATGVGNNDKMYGESEHAKTVRICLDRMSDDALGEDYSRSAMPGKNKSTASKDIDLFQLDEPKIGKHTIVSVSLSNTKARIWFGVEREGFGPELSTLSPWTVFIERLAEMADSALLRLEREQIQNEAAETRLEMLQMQNEAAETRLEMLQMQNEAAETRSLATYVVTSHTVFHQMQNMVRDLANPISTLNEMADAGVLGVSQEIKDLTDMINKSAEKLLDFASAFMNVKKMDAHRPCTLQEVIAESKELFDVSLKNNRISLDVELPNDLKIDIPFNVAFLAISNLLSNAKDAIGKRGGKIRIEAEAVRDLVYCSVINNGPPVDPEIRKDLFRKIGVSTKQGQTIRGWGLYLAHKSLSENRGHIELTKSDPTETRFTIKFPRVRQEQI